MEKIPLAAMIGNRDNDYENLNKPAAAEHLETSIISAHMKYFNINSEAPVHFRDEESSLYDTVIKYFEQ